MATIVPPVPYKTPVLDQNGFLAEPWSKWFRQLAERVGGTVALSNTELAGSPSTLIGTQVTSLQTLTTTHTTQIANLEGALTQGRQL